MKHRSLKDTNRGTMDGITKKPIPLLSFSDFPFLF